MSSQDKGACPHLVLPSQDELLANLHRLAASVDPIARCLAACINRQFVHPDGRTDDLDDVYLSPPLLGLIAYLSQKCPTSLSAEAGFGMGSSTTVILAARRLIGARFEHFAFDPYGLPDGRGEVVESYLETEFGKDFRRVRERSDFGLAQLAHERGHGSAGFIFIDGSHLFENIMADFVQADLLCCVGGFIVFDDAWFPAIETVINYIRSNRPDYTIADLVVPNTSVIQKVGPDRREWCAFRPFEMPDRLDWTPIIAAPDVDSIKS